MSSAASWHGAAEASECGRGNAAGLTSILVRLAAAYRSEEKTNSTRRHLPSAAVTNIPLV